MLGFFVSCTSWENNVGSLTSTMKDFLEKNGDKKGRDIMNLV